jgi:arylsulfatase A-like enzyme
LTQIERVVPVPGGERAAGGLAATDGHETAEQGVSAGDVFVIAAFVAFAVGFTEAAVLGFRKLVLGEVIHLSQHFVWMAPAAYLLSFLPVAIVLAGLARVFPRIRLHHVAGVLVFLAALGVLLMFQQLHRAAMLVLAAGVGFQAARVVARRREATVRLARRATPAFAALAAVAFVAVSSALALRERGARAALGAPPAAAKNVVFIILDTVRAASLSLYGYDRPTTPELERWARRGVVFDNAFSPSPWTLPSHASMFTGRHPHELTANWQTPLDARYPTLADILAARGYVTAGFASNPFYTTYEHGLDRGFVHYEDYRVSLGQTLNSGSLPAFILAGRPGFSQNIFRRILSNYEYLGRKTADIVTRDFLSWLEASDERPFFAFLNYMDSHVPFEPPAEWAERFDVRPPRPLLDRLVDDRSMWTPEERAAGAYDRDRYDATIAFTDAQLGVLFDALEQRDLLDETVVIVTADHGEHLGEHALYGHANSLYPQLLHVPLVIWEPDAAPARIAEYASLRSLPATVLDLIDLEGQADLPGGSLAPLWRDGGRPPADALVASVRRGLDVAENATNADGDAHALTEDGRHYILNPDGRQELFDLRSDPHGARDLAESRDGGEIIARLRDALLRLVPAAAERTDTGADGERSR